MVKIVKKKKKKKRDNAQRREKGVVYIYREERETKETEE